MIESVSRRLTAEGAERAVIDDLAQADALLAACEPPQPAARARLALRSDGGLVDCNARASLLFGIDPATARLAELGERLGAAASGEVFFEVESPSGEAVLLHGLLLPDGRVWQIEEVCGGAGAGLREAIAACWSLTPTEADIAQALLAGRTSEEIAQTSGRALGTVRQTIKSVLAKLKVHSRAQAVARMAALAAARIARPARAEDAVARRCTLRVPGHPQPVVFWRIGEPGGIPVLFLHGALYGILGRVDFARESRLFGLDVLAPERPGYGDAPLAEGLDPVPLVVEQAIAILDAAGIDRVLLHAHDVGTAYAFALAHARPERVAGIVCAPATPPMRGFSQTSDMPPLHRVSAFAAQKLPSLMERLVLLGLARIAREGVSAIPKLVFADSDHDREAFADPAARPVLEHLHGFALGQGARGFVEDMFVTNRDWSGLLPGIACPVRLLHGERSRTVSRKALEAMVAGLPDARLVSLPDAGHTLPLTHATAGMRELLRLAD